MLIFSKTLKELKNDIDEIKTSLKEQEAKLNTLNAELLNSNGMQKAIIFWTGVLKR